MRDRIETLDDVRRARVDDAFGSSVAQADRSKTRYTQYYWLLDVLTKEAQAYAERNTMDAEAFRHGIGHEDSPLSAAVDVSWDLRYALVQYDRLDNPDTFNFWRHEKQPLRLVQGQQTPYIHREQLEEAVGKYLKLPFRSEQLDKLLVDVLVATEMYGFAEAMLNEQTFGLFPARSPLKQRHVFRSYLGGIAIYGAVLLSAAAGFAYAGVQGWIGQGWGIGIAAILVLLFAVLSAWDTFALPFAWRSQSKAKAQAAKLMTDMFSFYSELDSTGPLSAQRVRERASELAALGVVWPASLFAMLDDSIRRTGRLG